MCQPLIKPKRFEKVKSKIQFFIKKFSSPFQQVINNLLINHHKNVTQVSITLYIRELW